MADIGLGRFGDRRLEKGGPFCMPGWWSWAAAGSRRASSGGDRAGEIRIWRFLHNRAVMVEEMVASAAARTLAQAAGRHVLAIQDTTMVRSAPQGLGVALHPVLAIDAVEGTVLGLVDANFMVRRGGRRGRRLHVDLVHKESRRWLEYGGRTALRKRPAKAGIQGRSHRPLGPRLRGDERYRIANHFRPILQAPCATARLPAITMNQGAQPGR